MMDLATRMSSAGSNSKLPPTFMGHKCLPPLMNRLNTIRDPIRIGLVGMGSMGRGLLHQCSITPGFECVALADIEPQRAIDCATQQGLRAKLARTAGEVNDAIREGFTAICQDGALVAGCDSASVLVEATNSVADAGRFCVTALESGKHLVMMNSEADLIFGPYLMREAHERGVVYTSCDGDQHGVIRRLVNQIELWGFDLVMAGNIKGFLDRYSNPTKIVPEADARNLDYKMATAYTDGTKLCIEMALVANALGLRTPVTGMNGPRADDVHEVFQRFDFESLWAGREAFVDYILGAKPGGGVFAIGHCDHPYQQSMMSYYKMGPGPFYLFYRPYHLCHIESMECIAAAALDGQSLLEPSFGFRTNVYAYAKRDLHSGERLDGIGGYCCFGLIENCYEADHSGLPICLAENVTLRRDVARDSPILLSDVTIPEGRIDFELYDRALNKAEAVP